MTFILAGGLLTACTTGSDTDPTVSNPTTPPVATASSPGSTEPTVTTESTTTQPPLPEGTVVPFRPVTPDSAKGKRIGLLAPAGPDALGNAVTVSVTDQLDLAGAEVISCDPGEDAALVLDCARRLATQQVDGWIALQPGDLGDALCEAGPKDVPFIAIAASPASCQTAVVGADHRQAGFLVGAALGAESKKKSNCSFDALVIVTNGAADIVSANRVAGIRDGFATECPTTDDDETILDAGTREVAFKDFTTLLTGLPADADVLVAAVNDAAALGVSAAIPESRINHIRLAAIGADQQARCMIVADSPWIGDAALFPDRYGEVAVPALIDALAGRMPPRSLYIETTFVNSKNMSEFYNSEECPTT